MQNFNFFYRFSTCIKKKNKAKKAQKYINVNIMSKVELWVVLLYYISPEGAKQGQIIYLEIWIILFNN